MDSFSGLVKTYGFTTAIAKVKDNIWDNRCQDVIREKNSNKNQNIEGNAHKTIDIRELFTI